MYDALSENFRFRLQQLVNEYGTRVKLAQVLGVSYQHIANWLIDKYKPTETQLRNIEKKTKKAKGWFDEPVSTEELQRHQQLGKIYFDNLHYIINQFDSRTEFSKYIGIERAILYRYLSGEYKISAKTARKIEKKFKQPVGWFNMPIDTPIDVPQKSNEKFKKAIETKNLQKVYYHNIKNLIKQAGSQKRLCNKLSLNRQKVSAWLNANAKISDYYARKIERNLDKPNGWFDTPITEKLPCLQMAEIKKMTPIQIKKMNESSNARKSKSALDSFMQYRRQQKNIFGKQIRK